MSLETDAVDLDTVGLDESEDAGSTVGLGTVVLKIVIVVVEVSVGVDLRSELEGKWNVGFTNGVVENGLAIRSILLKSY